MKRIYLILSVFAVLLAACQTAPEPVSVDLEAEKAAVNSFFEGFHSARKAGDAVTLATYLSDDVLGCGTDPTEFFNKQVVEEIWAEMLSDSVPELEFISDRIVKVAPDGNSAIVVEQYMMPMYTPKIPWRNVYYLLKTGDQWKILFWSAAFIPKNEDIPKLNAALE